MDTATGATMQQIEKAIKDGVEARKVEQMWRDEFSRVTTEQIAKLREMLAQREYDVARQSRR